MHVVLQTIGPACRPYKKSFSYEPDMKLILCFLVLALTGCTSTHSFDVDYAEFLPLLFELNVGYFCVALAGEKDRERVLRIIKENMKPEQQVFVGVVAPIDPRIDTPEEVRDQVIEAAKYIPIEQMGTTDDCGYAPFSDDTSTSRDTAFAKIRARVEGTALAADIIAGG